MKRLLGLLGIGLFTVLVVATVRTATAPSRQLVAPPVDEAVDAAAASGRLAEALRIATVAPAPGEHPEAELERLQALLAERFPGVERALSKELVGGRGMLLTWAGTDPTLKPLVLMAHQDVVPATDVEHWAHPPFGGEVADGYVWGRGALDDKGSLLAIFEALEGLLREGSSPRRTVLVLSGHDEETTGRDGTAKIAALLASRRVVPEVVLDEGSIIADGIVPGVTPPVALIGLAEKGYATVDLDVAFPGGHSSMPASETAIGVLARAVDRVQSHPMPAQLSATARGMFEFLGPSMAPLPRFLSANLWFGAPLLRRALGGSPSGNALIRTTIAPTLLSGGVSENVLAPSARATVNFRILPGDTVAGVVEHVRRAIDDDRVRLTLHAGAQEPSPVSSVDGPGFAAIQRAVAETFPGTLVAPSLVLAATDARYLAPLCDCVYRFVPFRLREDDLPRFHGVDERVSVEGYADAIRFYRRFLRTAAF